MLLLEGIEWTDASAVMSSIKVRKTPDEIACIRHAQRITELAMTTALDTLRPGLRQVDLSAAFLRSRTSLAPRRTASIPSGR